MYELYMDKSQSTNFESENNIFLCGKITVYDAENACFDVKKRDFLYEPDRTIQIEDICKYIQYTLQCPLPSGTVSEHFPSKKMIIVDIFRNKSIYLYDRSIGLPRASKEQNQSK